MCPIESMPLPIPSSCLWRYGSHLAPGKYYLLAGKFVENLVAVRTASHNIGHVSGSATPKAYSRIVLFQRGSTLSTVCFVNGHHSVLPVILGTGQQPFVCVCLQLIVPASPVGCLRRICYNASLLLPLSYGNYILSTQRCDIVIVASISFPYI